MYGKTGKALLSALNQNIDDQAARINFKDKLKSEELRDHLAAKYSEIHLEFCISSGEPYCLEDLAKESYRFADAMIREREKKEDGGSDED